MKTKESKKVENYTTAQTAELVAAYQAAPDQNARDAVVAEFASKFNKSTRSIISKLSREGVYVKATPVSKSGDPVLTKEELRDRVKESADAQGFNANHFDSLDKASKQCGFAVLAVLAMLAEARAEVDDLSAENAALAATGDETAVG